MKVYLSCDMEGVSGIASWRAASSGKPNYPEGRKLMTADVNAAVAAAFEAGASEVLVQDAHGGAHNLLVEELDARAQVIQGWQNEPLMVAGIDDSFEAAVLLGYHARACTPDGLMCHTFSEAFLAVRVNGTVIGETGLSALHAGKHDVPVVAVTGDAAVAREAKELLPWVATATVKWALARECARMLPPPQARKLIAQAVAVGLQSAQSGSARPLSLAEPLQVEIDLAHAVEASRIVQLHGGRRLGPVTVGFELVNGEELARLIGGLF